MTLSLHTLAGCTPSPLANYLKALGVIRLVAQQADPEARAFFQGDQLCLATQLNRSRLLQFFLESYQPTPILDPWNGGSGFYPKDKKDAIDAIARSQNPRFSAFAQSIATTKNLVGTREQSPKDEEKFELLNLCRTYWTGPALDWFRAAVALGVGADARAAYPAVLGTGGNDGRLDFTNNFMQHIVALLDPITGAPLKDADNLLELALFNIPAPVLTTAAIGQFSPGGAGGVNASAGFEGAALVNRWDFVLMLEGTVALAVATARRLETGRNSAQLAAPFALPAAGAGYASASEADESTRGEQWYPLWSRPATWGEISDLFAEGRLQLPQGRAERPTQAAQAIARLGVSRGIEAFERYGFIERNGQANLAVPLGRWPVSHNPNIRLLDDIDPWLGRLRSQLGSKAPASLTREFRRVEAAVLQVCRAPEPMAWEDLLIALGRLEGLLLARPKHTASMTYLRPLLLERGDDWIGQLDRRRPEISLAVALATTSHFKLGPVRQHIAPVTADKKDWVKDFGERKIAQATWREQAPVDNVVDLVQRRFLEARRAGLNYFPASSPYPAPWDHVERWVRGDLSAAQMVKMAQLVPALAACQVDGYAQPFEEDIDPSAPLTFLRVLYPPREPDESRARLDPRPLTLWASERPDEANRAALDRLRSWGYRPRVHQNLFIDATTGRRLVASLAFPVKNDAINDAMAHWLKPDEERN